MENNGEFHTEVLKYIGKTLRKEGEGAKGPWKLWKLQFEVEGGQFPRGFTMFGPASPKSVQIKDLEEGQYYEIVHLLEPYTGKYGPVVARRAVILKESTKEQYTGPADKKPVVAKPVIDFAPFKADYAKGTEGSTDSTAVHMLGAYVATYHAEEFKEVIQKCKEHFTK